MMDLGQAVDGKTLLTESSYQLIVRSCRPPLCVHLTARVLTLPCRL